MKELQIWNILFIVATLINFTFSYMLRKGTMLPETLIERRNEAKWLIWLLSWIVCIALLLYFVSTGKDVVLNLLTLGQVSLMVYRYFKMPMTTKWFFPVHGIWTLIVIGYIVLSVF